MSQAYLNEYIEVPGGITERELVSYEWTPRVVIPREERIALTRIWSAVRWIKWRRARRKPGISWVVPFKHGLLSTRIGITDGPGA